LVQLTTQSFCSALQRIGSATAACAQSRPSPTTAAALSNLPVTDILSVSCRKNDGDSGTAHLAIVHIPRIAAWT
jgi:hypothetical protein